MMIISPLQYITMNITITTGETSPLVSPICQEAETLLREAESLLRRGRRFNINIWAPGRFHMEKHQVENCEKPSKAGKQLR